jgi:hypothetical protein
MLPDDVISSPSRVPAMLWGAYFGLLTYCPENSRITRRILANALLQLDTTIPRIASKQAANEEACRFLAPYRITCHYEETEE